MINMLEMKSCGILPREWAEGASCPICERICLTIEAIPDAPDQMVCSGCGCSFEVATDGFHVKLVTAPILLTSCVDFTWRRPAELRELVYKSIHPREDARVHSAVVDPLDKSVLRERAAELQRLGNPFERIQSILLGLPGASADAVQVVVSEIKEAQELRQHRILRGTYTAILGVLIAIGLVAFLTSQTNVGAAFFGSQANEKPGDIIMRLLTNSTEVPSNPAASAQQTPIPQLDQYIDPSTLPQPLQAAIPAGAKILKPPDVVVKPGKATGQMVRCPVSIGDAVRLFGGDIKIWSKAVGGFTLISPSPQTIYVPEGMEAGYFEYLDAPSFSSVLGPATIENVNFAAVSCE